MPDDPNDPVEPNEPAPPSKSNEAASASSGSATPLFAANEKISTINVAEEIKNSFLDYSMSVIISRALPNLLVNGGTGIAVGMATNIPPHNLGEIIDAVCAQIDNPNIDLKELMKLVKGPDFPTGCMVCGTEGIRDYFHAGRGSLKVRG